MHVLPEIATTFANGKASMFPDRKADAQNTVFVAGQYVTVSLLGDPSKQRPDMERLDSLDEAWATCYRSPRPGWRLLGRFTSVNVFVGTALWDRGVLAKRKNYHAKADEMLKAWEESFPDLPIVRSSTVEGYLTGYTRDVDQSPF